MADNFVANAGIGGDTFAADDVAGVKWPRTKLSLGADGVNDGDVSAANPLPVSGTFFQATQPVSGTVTVGNASLAVTGSFFQATQPVSIASMPSTPVTGTFWQATQPVSGPLTDAQLRATAVPVSLASTTVTGSVAVTGTFWQATQPVSGPLTDTQLRATAVPVTMTSTTVTGSVAVTGTFWQATQPISAASLPLPVGAATETTLAALNTKVTAVNTGAVTISAALPAGANSIGTTPGPALTKGAQGTVGHSVQQLNNAGRVIVNAATAIAGVTAVTVEALLSLNVSRDGAATAAATTIAVTSGKRLRILGVTVGCISTAAAVLSARISLRMNPAGVVAATSPILCILPLSQQAAALAQAGNEMSVMFSEAIEISGTMQVGLSQVASAITGTVWASLIAYEY
ncbi:MAG: hypothetical protein M3R16_05035 [Pseudomonadota bacterium]|nr:hypothetical protein [Pseudomonadota bacterium]